MSLQVSQAEVVLLKHHAATLIQAHYRGYLTRRRLAEALGAPQKFTPAAPNAGFRMRRRSSLARAAMPPARFVSGQVESWDQLLRDYEIGKLLGEGNFACVFACTHRRTESCEH